MTHAQTPEQSLASQINLYQLIGVPPDAPQQVLEDKRKKAHALWIKRESKGSLDRQQEAQRNSAWLQQAKEIFAVPARRAAYDQALASVGQQQGAAAPTGPAGRNPLEAARANLANGNYHGANYEAREAERTLGPSAELWSIKARASSGLGNVRDALYEVQQARQLDPQNLDHPLLEADLYEELEQWDQALRLYQSIGQIPGGAEEGDYGIAGVFIETGRTQEAIGILERLQTHGSDKARATLVLALALLVHAQNIPEVQDEDSYIITKAGEIPPMVQCLERIRSLGRFPDLEEDIQSLADTLHHAQERDFMDLSTGRIVKMVAVWVGITLLLTIIGALFEAGTFFFLIGLLISGGRVAWAIHRDRKPGWQRAAITYRRILAQREYAQSEAERAQAARTLGIDPDYPY